MRKILRLIYKYLYKNLFTNKVEITLNKINKTLEDSENSNHIDKTLKLSKQYFKDYSKNVINNAATNGRTTINQVYSATAPPSVYVGFPSAKKEIKLAFTISSDHIHLYLQFFYFEITSKQ